MILCVHISVLYKCSFVHFVFYHKALPHDQNKDRPLHGEEDTSIETTPIINEPADYVTKIEWIVTAIQLRGEP